MSNILLKSRCTKGHLIIYDTKVSIELSGLGVKNENTLPYDQITGVEMKTTMAEIPFLSKGAATIKIFGLGDQKLEALFVIVKDAKKAKELIEERIGKPADNNSKLEEIEKLGVLKEKGLITSEEFDSKKKQLLGL